MLNHGMPTPLSTAVRPSLNTMQKETTTASPRTLFVKVDLFDTKNRDCAGNVWRSAGNAFLETVGRKSRSVGETTVLNMYRCMINYELLADILCFYTNGTGALAG